MDFYLPREINFSREQMIWLIEWLPTLETGNWPGNPQDTGYTDTAGVQRSHSHHAPFETAAQIYAEVTARLRRTRRSGETLVWEVQHGLADYNLLCPAAKDAINYISGWRRRHVSFSQWQADKKYLQKTINI